MIPVGSGVGDTSGIFDPVRTLDNQFLDQVKQDGFLLPFYGRDRSVAIEGLVPLNENNSQLFARSNTSSLCSSLSGSVKTIEIVSQKILSSKFRSIELNKNTCQ